MPIVGYARVSTTGQDLAVQLEKLQAARCDKIFKEKRSGVDAGRPELKRCLEYLREGDMLLVTKVDRLARSTSDLYRIVSLLAEKGVAFKVIDDPSIDTTSRTGKLVLGILALIAEFENDIRRERQMDGIAKAKERGVRFGRKRELTDEAIAEVPVGSGSGVAIRSAATLVHVPVHGQAEGVGFSMAGGRDVRWNDAQRKRPDPDPEIRKFREWLIAAPESCVTWWRTSQR